MHREIRLYILGKYLSWDKGRQLTAFGNITFTYNASGIRTSKTVGGTKHSYILDGTKILKETWGDNTIIPLYSNEGDTCGIIYNGEPYYFIKNLQGDIISVTDKNGNTVAKYSYDAWGVCTIISDSSNCNIATVNPYRYRGYYYDTETKLYYIQTRYYDPCYFSVSFPFLFKFRKASPVRRISSKIFRTCFIIVHLKSSHVRSTYTGSPIPPGSSPDDEVPQSEGL